MKEVKEVMALFYITPFSISVLNVAIMLALLIVFLWLIPEKFPATRHLLTFLAGVEVVFVAFFYIFSSLDLESIRVAWWALHFVAFFIVFLVQFAYAYPRPHFESEARMVLRLTLAASALVYGYYLYHTTLVKPVFASGGNLFVFLGTPEIGILVGIELLWTMIVFGRTVTMLKKELESADDEDAIVLRGHISAIRRLQLILLSPFVLVSCIVLAYLGLSSWEVVGHLLGTGLMVFVFFFTVVYLNHAVEPTTLLVKMVGLSLGAILIILGFSSAITMDLHKQSFLSLKEMETERAETLLVNGRFEELPKEIAYVAKEGRTVFARASLPAHLDTKQQSWGNGWLFRQLDPRDPAMFFLARQARFGEESFEVGYQYVEYRRFIDATARPMTFLVIGAVLLVLVTFPLFFRLCLFNPLRRLLAGVDTLDRGGLDVKIPVSIRDEIGLLTHSFNHMVRSVRESREQLRAAYNHQIDLTESYSRFVPEEILSTLNKGSILELGLGDNVEREMTVMFSDIRAFTTMSESMSPGEVFHFINRYLERVGPVVRKHGGYIDKYIGDAVMALYPTGPDAALAAAVEMQAEVRRLNEELAGEAGGRIPLTLKIGIGIHTGELMLGTIGERERMEGTVISDAVNLASRIEGLTKVYDAPILISQGVSEKLTDPAAFSMRCLDRVKVKGKSKWVDIVEVVDGEGEAQRQRKLASRTEFEAAVAEFQDCRFKQALERFETLATENPEDIAVSIYRERCQRFIDQGIPEDWDGATEIGGHHI